MLQTQKKKTEYGLQSLYSLEEKQHARDILAC